MKPLPPPPSLMINININPTNRVLPTSSQQKLLSSCQTPSHSPESHRTNSREGERMAAYKLTMKLLRRLWRFAMAGKVLCLLIYQNFQPRQPSPSIGLSLGRPRTYRRRTMAVHSSVWLLRLHFLTKDYKSSEHLLACRLWAQTTVLGQGLISTRAAHSKTSILTRRQTYGPVCC